MFCVSVGRKWESVPQGAAVKKHTYIVRPNVEAKPHHVKQEFVGRYTTLQNPPIDVEDISKAWWTQLLLDF